MIPTAEEYIDFMDLESGFKLTPTEIKIYGRRMKDFAKLHVEAALKKAKYLKDPEHIQNAYPLTNIK
jgi:hypothetical protein